MMGGRWLSVNVLLMNIARYRSLFVCFFAVVVASWEMHVVTKFFARGVRRREKRGCVGGGGGKRPE